MRSTLPLFLLSLCCLFGCEASTTDLDQPRKPSSSSSSSGAAPSSAETADDGSPIPGAGTSAPQDTDAGPASSPAPAGCAATAKAGDLDWTLLSKGRTRTVRVHVPKGYNSQTRTPVVINFHGRNSTASQQELLSGMTPKSDAAGFLLVYPTGVGQTWNDGLCCGQAQSENVDDVAFTKDLIDELNAKLCVDNKRIFATGLSNGAFMANRLACELSDRIAAIGPVAGQLLTTSCAPTRPVPLMHFHGTADNVVAYGGQFGTPSVESSIKAWAARNGCAATPTATYAKGDTTCETYGSCKQGADVTLCKIEGGGHTWPGGFAVPGLGKTTKDIDATDAMWSFFAAHPMP